MTDFPPTHRASRQSPIALVPEFTSTVTPAYLKFDWPASVTAHPRTPTDPGAHHGTRFSILAGPTSSGGIVLDGHRYILRELHFHAPSEHFDGEVQYAGELHLVHQSPVDARHAVVAVFLDASGDPAATSPDASAACTAIIAEGLCQLTGPPSGTAVTFSPRGLLPSSREFFRYQGSLTTAPFAEAVSWIVMARPIACNDPDLIVLGARADEDARPIQDRDRRIIVRCQPIGD